MYKRGDYAKTLEKNKEVSTKKDNKRPWKSEVRQAISVPSKIRNNREGMVVYQEVAGSTLPNEASMSAQQFPSQKIWEQITIAIKEW